MKHALALGLSVSAASSFWAEHAKAATPKKGGIFRVGIHYGHTSDSLDPALTESVYMIQLNHAIRSYLTEITSDNTLGPDLAERWESSPDAKEWKFYLHKGVTFHNGKPLTAKDVVASLNHHRGETSKSAAKPLLAEVAEIVDEDATTVVIKLSSGSADLPYLLTDYHLVILPSDEAGNVDFQSGIGTGPFELVAHDPGVSSQLKRFENYHRDVWFDGVELLTLNDPNARQSALLTDQVDAISEVDIQTADLLAREQDIQIDDLPSGAHVTMAMRCDQAPFNDVNIRLALKHAINREEIVQKVGRGYGTLGNDHPIGKSLPYWADLEQRQYDPDRAKFYLKKANADGLSVSISTTDGLFGGAVDMCLLFKDHASRAGITVDVVREPSDGYGSNVWLVKPFVVAAWGARPTPDIMFSTAYRAGADWNESRWANPEFNRLLTEAKAELDQEKRGAMYRQMQELCRDDGGTIVPFFRNRVSARRSRVAHGDKMASNWELDGARAYQRWWFA